MYRLPEKLVELRKHYQFSQESIANWLDIEVEEYMGIENGRKILTYKQLLILANLYQIEVKELFINDLNVSLHDYNNIAKDQENIDYFLNETKWYSKIIKKIKKSLAVKIIGGCILAVLLVGTILYVVDDLSPVDLSQNKFDRLSVSNKIVAYVDENNVLHTTGDIGSLTSEDVAKVCAGEDFIVALKTDGTVASYGLDKETENKIDDLKNIVDISVSNNHIIAINKKDKYYTFGTNEYGELDLGKMKDCKNLKTFENGTIAIDEDGYLVYAGEIVGRSQFKQYKNCLDYDANENMTVVLRSDNTIDYSAREDKFAIATGWKDITKVCCGNNFIAGLLKNGTVVIACEDEEMLNAVKEWKKIISIDAGKDYLIGYDGEEIFGAGNNKYNQFEKEEIVKIKLPQVSRDAIVIDFLEKTIEVSLNSVENAIGYEVTLISSKEEKVTIANNEKASFSSENLEEGVTYTLKIVTLGKDEYVNSDALSYSFEYKAKVEEESDENKDKDKEENSTTVIEVPFPVYHFIGKTKAEFEDYIGKYDIPKENITAIEDESHICDGEVKILEVTGYEDGENITKPELQKRKITYKYCKLGD